MRDKISKLMKHKLLVLNSYATNFYEVEFSKFSEIELFMLLLNYCNEDLIRKFLINCRKEVYVKYFGHGFFC